MFECLSCDPFQILKFVDEKQDDGVPLVVLGEAGMGKTSILAKVVETVEANK